MISRGFKFQVLRKDFSSFLFSVKQEEESPPYEGNSAYRFGGIVTMRRSDCVYCISESEQVIERIRPCDSSEKTSLAGGFELLVVLVQCGDLYFFDVNDPHQLIPYLDHNHTV